MNDGIDKTEPIQGGAPSERPERIGPYRCLREIGQGGFGTVYLAEQTEPVKRRVALKVLKPGMDSREVLARFQAERQALAVMEHPGIAKFLDAGLTQQGRPYFAMEYVPGVPITEFCRQEKLPLEARLELMIQVCQAVQHAHSKGLLHRDLKPSNILVQLVDHKPVAKVIDFGVAKALVQPLTQEAVYTEIGQVIGTPEYMSPEQARGSAVDVDTRADVYSLGAVLYELLTGVPPFGVTKLRGKGYVELQRMIEETIPPTPSDRVLMLEDSSDGPVSSLLDSKSIRRSLKEGLDWIVMKCLEKERDRRYATANGLAMDLRRYLDDEPVVARPPSPAYRAKVFLRRNRLGVIAAGLIALAVLVGLAVATVGFVRAIQEAERARLAEQRALAFAEIVQGDTVSMAVLPLANGSGDREQDFFADGTTATLIAHLSTIDALRVVSDRSVQRYRDSTLPLAEIADQLDVDGILKGSVEWSGDLVRIDLDLIHPLSERYLWGKTFEDRLQNISLLQARVARAVAEELRLPMSMEERRHLASVQQVDPRAYVHYLRGKHHLLEPGEAEAEEAIRSFEQSIELDPEFAPAHAGVAFAYRNLNNWYRPPREVMPKMRAAAERAIELDPSLAEAHAALGFVSFRYDWDWERARDEFQAALDLNPNLAFAQLGMAEYYKTNLQYADAKEALERAYQMDPVSTMSDLTYFFLPYFSRDYQAVIENAERALRLDPDAHWPYEIRGLALAELGRYQEAIQDVEHAGTLDDSPLAAMSQGYVYAKAGMPGKARQMLAELERQSEYRFVCYYEVATIETALGDVDGAFDSMDRAIRDRSGCIPNLRADVRLDPMREDPRFSEILRRTNHPVGGEFE